MTTVPAILSDLHRRDVHISVVGDRLLLDAPAGTITPALRHKVARHKAEILAVVNGERGSTHVTEITENPISVISVTPFVGLSTPTSEESTQCIDAYRLRISDARSWDDLYALLADAEVAYAAHELSGEEVEVLAATCAREAHALPDHPPEDR